MTANAEKYFDFLQRLSLLIRKNPNLIKTTLSNIFTMRLIGNKTHGDLAEIAISEFVNQYMYDFRSQHVGKHLFRAKQHEEDIEIIREMDKEKFSISLKAYGNGPLQLSTDKSSRFFSGLEREHLPVIEKEKIQSILDSEDFAEFGALNILPLIYDEKNKRCNILVFDFTAARQAIYQIRQEVAGAGRKHPVYRFYDNQDGYICEVRYGSASANALQRGLWTHTEKAAPYFFSITNGWINYQENPILVHLFSTALLSTPDGHKNALELLEQDVEKQKSTEGLSKRSGSFL